MPRARKYAAPAEPEGSQEATKPIGTNDQKRQGNETGVKVEKVSFSKSKQDSWTELLLICAYIIQSRGGATVAEVFEDIKALGGKTREGTVSDAVEALRKQEILAVAQNAAGHRVYSMKRVKFNCNPEMGSIKALVQTLKSDSTGQLIIEKFKKPSDAKAKFPFPTQPHDYKIKMRLTDAILGSQIWGGNDDLQQLYFNASNNHTLHKKNGSGLQKDTKGNYVLKDEFQDHNNVPMMFDRWFDGRIVAAHPATIRGFFKSAFEALQPPTKRPIRSWDVERFFCPEHVLVDVEMDTGLKKLPVMRSGESQTRGGGSAAPKNYESLPPGTELTMVVSVPAKDFITPQEFKQWLAVALKRSPGFFSPARGRQCGAAELVSLETKPTFEGDWQEV